MSDIHEHVHWSFPSINMFEDFLIPKCGCGEALDECWLATSDYPWCNTCKDHHRQYTGRWCDIDEKGRALEPDNGVPWEVFGY